MDGRSRARKRRHAALLSAAATAWLALGTGQAAAQDPPLPTTSLGDREVAATEVLVQLRGEPLERAVPVDPAVGVRGTLRVLRSNPEVRWAGPNAIAHATRTPRDPGRSGKRGGWQDDQWNFLAPPPVGTSCTGSDPCGVNAPRAWDLLRKAGRPEGRRPGGKRGAIVAVIDTGVAYRNYKRFKRSPDIAKGAAVQGKDFVGDDRLPLDQNGHGTHVASTIFEQAGNRKGVTGLADGLRLMPIRVLNGGGSGSAKDVARGIRWATRNGAKVINLSLEFDPSFGGCGALRPVCRAIRAAQRAEIVVVGAAGNESATSAQMPAKIALGVASSTVRGCLSEFSSRGPGVDITAPGGGADARATRGGSHCRPFAPGPTIIQMTLRDGGGFKRFGYPPYEGTSMSAPHVSAAAGLVLSSRVLADKLGRRPTADEVEAWLECTARPIPDPIAGPLYGAGLLDLAAALDPASSCPGVA